MGKIGCAICGKLLTWVEADPDAEAPSKFGGWYCEPCDAYSETDIEVDE